jgi:hypothetical protein
MLIWKPTKQDVDRTLSIYETDFETSRRQKRLSDSQSVDWFVAFVWIVSAMVVAVWVRIGYLAVVASYHAVLTMLPK